MTRFGWALAALLLCARTRAEDTAAAPDGGTAASPDGGTAPRGAVQGPGIAVPITGGLTGRATALPGVRALVGRAVAAARARGPLATRALARRARLSGLLPELRLGVERGSQADLALSDTGVSARTSNSQGDALKLQASLTFDLPRLVFAPEEVRLLSIERWLGNDLQELVEQVVALYFRYRRLLRSLPSAEDEDAARDELEEVSALLDLLTGGGLGARSAAPGSETLLGGQ